MKKFLIGFVLETLIDLAISALRKLSRRSDNTIDDKIVAVVAGNRDALIKEIKRAL